MNKSLSGSVDYTDNQTLKALNDMKGFPIIIAALGGALVGAATALLLAPQKGSETREAIKDFILTHVPGIKATELESLADQIADEIKDVK